MPVFVSSVILRSLRLIGEKQRGGTLTANEQAECLDSLNGMLESWANERLLCYHINQESFALTTGTVSASIGSSGTFNTVRPTRIVDPCFVRDSNNYDTPLTIINNEAYGKLGLKNYGSTYPSFLFYDPNYTASTGTIYLHPSAGASLTLFINSWQQLPNLSSMSMQLNLPPGYKRAIEFNYAIEEAGGFAKVDPWVSAIARTSLAALKSVNLPAPVSRLDAGIVRGYRSNVFTGP